MRTVFCSSFLFWEQPAGFTKREAKHFFSLGIPLKSLYVLCQKGTEPSSCEEEDGQHYILMIGPCISESGAHLASGGCLKIMVFKPAGVLFCRGLYLTKLEESSWENVS